MKKFWLSALAVLLVGTVASAQSERRYSQPAVPTPADLDRLNLAMDWRIYLPVDGKRDGIFSMQILEKQLLVLMRSGAVLAFDPDTGVNQWRTFVGNPYVPAIGFSSNTRTVFVAKGVEVYALDRKTGSLQWEFYLPNAPSAAPVADNDRFYIPLGTNRLHAYTLPDLDAPPTAPMMEKKPEAEPIGKLDEASRFYQNRGRSAFGVSGQTSGSVSAVSSNNRTLGSVGALATAAQATQRTSYNLRPEPLWDYITESQPETRIEQACVLTADYLFQVGQNGLFFAISKYEPRIFYRYTADASVAAPLGQYGEIAYVPSDDFRVYALDIVTGKILWRFVGGGPIRQKPRVTDDSLYVSAERAGLYRLNRESGDLLWRNNKAQRYLASNKKFVYAADVSGRLLILDRARGTELASYDPARDFVLPLTNELTDRIYLSSNDGLLVSLHDRDYKSPLRVYNAVEKAPSITTKVEPKKTAGDKAAPKADKPKPKAEEKMP